MIPSYQMFHYTRIHFSNPSSLQSTNKTKVSPNTKLDFEENSPFQEGIISETFQRLDKSFLQNPKELEDLIDKGNLIHKVCTQTNRH